MQRALFLDRDGIINEDFHYVHNKEQVQFVPGIFELTRAANALGFKTIVVTNQAGIAKGIYTTRDFINLMKWMKREFALRSASLDHIFYCPYHPEAKVLKYKQDSYFRKPNPGMIEKASKRFHLDLDRSFLVGDKFTDYLAGKNAGVGNIFLYSHEEAELLKVEEKTRVGSLLQVMSLLK